MRPQKSPRTLERWYETCTAWMRLLVCVGVEAACFPMDTAAAGVCNLVLSGLTSSTSGGTFCRASFFSEDILRLMS
jgi:hypothetical protein